MYWASYTLRKAIRNDRWPEDALTPIRRVIHHPGWVASMGLLLVAMVWFLAGDRHHRAYFWIIFLLLQTQTQIASAFAPSPVSRLPAAGRDWSSIAPLNSTHWGER